ncbi:histidine--tRNA ligase [Gammaproteobacteria bacterium]
MVKNIQAVRGMNDILPDVSSRWAAVESLLRCIVDQYGYKEIRLPLLESTELFKRTIGVATDVVEKEMYTFSDRSGDSLTLRPEGTAGCVRAGIEHGLFYNQVQRLFYFGPMFRYERPQKGRYRQFCQFGVEAYGLVGPDIDAEMMFLAARFWQELKIASKLELQINTLGNVATRACYRERLVEYFNNNYAALDEDSQRRLLVNPLRILDSKNVALQELIKNAPKIIDYLDFESQTHFDSLRKILDKAQLSYVVNPCLVRGLDYYCQTVFEWVTQELGAQGAVCAGGHYDGLVAQMGGKATPAIGFALGLERLIALTLNSLTLSDLRTVYLVLLGNTVIAEGMLLAEKIRACGAIRVVVNCGGGNLGTQLKRADKSAAELALILGETELASRKVIVKHLRTDKPQQNIKIEEIEKFIGSRRI